MTIQISCVGIDTNDVAGATAFWSGMTGYEVDSSADEYASLSDAEGKGPDLYIQLVPERPKGKNRLHLDLTSGDVAAETTRAIDLGAREVKSFIQSDGSGWVVLEDTDGNQFCICAA